MPAVENEVAVFGVSVGFFFFVSQVWPGSCEFGRLSVVWLSERIFAFKFFALPIVRLIKIAKVTIHASELFFFSSSGVLRRSLYVML